MTHLIRGLDLPDAQIRASIFDTLSTVAETASTDQSDSQGIIAEHAPTLTTAALQNALQSSITSAVCHSALFILLHLTIDSAEPTNFSSEAPRRPPAGCSI